MRFLTLAFLAVVTFAAAPADAIEFWHSGTLWAGQGQCSAVFTFDSEGEPIAGLRVTVSALDKAGKKLATDVLEIKEFGDSSATRYADAVMQGEAVCDEGLTIVVNSATATVDGKRVDLLKTKGLSAGDFKPFKIRVGK